MAFDTINFKRFLEGDKFDSNDLDTRFNDFEGNLNKGLIGLNPSAFAEGSLNYQHLDFENDSGTTFPNAGSHIMKLASVRNDPEKGRHDYVVYHAGVSGVSLSGITAPGWSSHAGVVIGEGPYLGTIRGSFAQRPISLSMSAAGDTDKEPIKLGENFVGSTGGRSRAALILFNTYCWKANRDGVGFEIQVRDQNLVWHPIIGSDRWIIDLNADDSTPLSSELTARTGHNVSIRILVDPDRLESQGAITSAVADALEITGVRVKMATVSASGTNDEVWLGNSYLTAIGLRGFK